MKLTLLAPQTAAHEVADSPREFDTSRYNTCIVAADTLATTEECDIQIYVGNDTWKAYHDGTAVVTLTATIPMRSLPCGPRYRVLKDATATACGVVAIFGQDKG